MKTTLGAGILAAALAATGAFGAQAVSPCDDAPGAKGMRERIETINRQADRIEGTTDRAELRVLMDLQMKHLHEGIREMRRRELPVGCRMDMIESMMDAMVRHEQVMHDAPGH